MIAGLPPVYGFYTAMITPIIAALFGSSCPKAVNVTVNKAITKLNATFFIFNFGFVFKNYRRKYTGCRLE